MSTPDYSEYQKPKSDDALAQLSQLAEEQLKRETARDVAEDALKLAKEELREISETAIPELMEKLGLEEFTTTGGIKIKVVEKIRASISAKVEKQAFAWLRENGHEALIKREIKIQFGMGEDAIAQDTVLKLEGLPVADKSSVHNQTLVKFVTEALSAGIDVPENLFNVHRQRVTNVRV